MSSILIRGSTIILKEGKNRIKTRYYQEIYQIIEKYDLVGIAWVSEDEYKSEAIDIANRAYVLSEEKLAIYIYQVFVFWLNEMVIKKDKAIYEQMAKKIKAILKN